MTKKKQETNASGQVKSPHGGVSGVSEMMNLLDSVTRDRLLGELKSRDPALASAIEDQMFLFEHLKFLTAKDLGLLAREVPQSRLVVALRGADSDVFDAFARSISKRQAQAIKDEIDSIGPQLKGDVDKAQAEILSATRSLETQGKITIRHNNNKNDDIIE